MEKKEKRKKSPVRDIIHVKIILFNLLFFKFLVTPTDNFKKHTGNENIERDCDTEQRELFVGYILEEVPEPRHNKATRLIQMPCYRITRSSLS